MTQEQTQEKHPLFQGLMDAAYARWQGNGWSKEQFWAQLDEGERMAVFIGNLNYQVENGGWAQWCDNGYVECADELEVILRDTLGTRTALAVAEMVCKVASAHEQFESDRRETPGYYYCTCDEECDCETEDDVWNSAYDTFSCVADPLCDRYYEINAQLLAEVEAHLNGQPVEKHVLVAKAATEAATEATATEANGLLTSIRCKLIGSDGNAFSIIGRVCEALRRGGRKDLVEPFKQEATSGDYNNLLCTAMRYVNVC